MSRTRTLIGDHRLSPSTLMMSYGFDPKLSEGAIKCPIFQTSTFAFESAAAGKSAMQLAYGLRERKPAEDPSLIYSRINNPTLEILEDRLTLWDGAEEALVFASGMAAISTTILSFARPGDVIAYGRPVYGGTDYLFEKLLPLFGIRAISFQAEASEAEVQDVLRSGVERYAGNGRVPIIFAETPANPTNKLVDLAMLARVANDLADQPGGRPKLIVDNTMMGPLWQRPLDHGVDVSVYSLTKYVGGHSDLVAGSCLGKKEDLASIRGFRTILGSMLDPHTAWLLLRSLETLSLRMRKAEASARDVAAFLRDHPKVESVSYLGFLDPDSEQGRIFARQCLGSGSTFSIILKGGEPESFRLLDALKLVKLAVSLGGTESLASYPFGMTHVDVDEATKLATGILPSLVRLSIGVEEPEDLIADFAQALDQV
ncbi:cystathionine gamma-synthase family protein [Sphingomonas sp. RB1R13]|uniref:cystathionine gamma-synthase family protein n=1 Tax=Sphingomonas sp. RB1R13 TaxID=3096159 RepID=UPI002FCC1B1A